MGLVVANFMDSSLADLKKKGVFSAVKDIYNPTRAYDVVLHFTPHCRDLDLAHELREHGIEVLVHPVAGLQPRKMVSTLIRLVRIFRERRVDIARGRLPYLGSLLGVLAARLTGRPSVVSLGGDNRIAQERNGSFYLGSKRLSYGVEWLTLQLATSIIVPNSFTKGYVGSIMGPRRASAKCVVIPWLSAPVPASDPGDRNLLAGLGIAPGTIVVPVIGFVNRYKYSDVLFDAIAQGPIAAPGNAPVLVCFLGDGPLRQEGEDRFPDRPDVRFLGWQERQVVHAFLRCADVVLIPMSGFVLLEAASLGKTVISSRVEWHGELIRDGETGYLVDPTSPAAWRQALARALAEDPQHRRQMSARLLALYQAEYALDIAVRRELELYQSLTSKAAAPQ